MNYKKFGEMSREEQVELFCKHLDKKIIQSSYDQTIWSSAACPLWHRSSYYREEPAPLTKSSINWSHVHPDIVAMATDDDDETFLYESAPEQRDICFCASRGDEFRAAMFSSFKPGTFAWEDSLVYRPGHEPK